MLLVSEMALGCKTASLFADHFSFSDRFLSSLSALLCESTFSRPYDFTILSQNKFVEKENPGFFFLSSLHLLEKRA